MIKPLLDFPAGTVDATALVATICPVERKFNLHRIGAPMASIGKDCPGLVALANGRQKSVSQTETHPR